MLEHNKRLYLATYTYFNQGILWVPKDKPPVHIVDMDMEWRYNCTQLLERNAPTTAYHYAMGEHYRLKTPIWREVMGENLDGTPVIGSRVFSEYDVLSDEVIDAIDDMTDYMHEKPVEWIRTTVLYRTLSIDFPTSVRKRHKLAQCARHWSGCAARISTRNDVSCTCDTIR